MNHSSLSFSLRLHNDGYLLLLEINEVRVELLCTISYKQWHLTPHQHTIMYANNM